MASPVAAALAPLLVGQLLQPSPQPGPVRLPGPAPPAAWPQRPPTKAPEPIPAPLLPAAPLPRVEGLERYSPAVLMRLLAPCLQPEPGGSAPLSASERLERCAALLTSRLVAEGYVNSRVFPLPDPAPNGTLLVVQGRIVEVRVESSDAALRRRLQRLVLPLQGLVLHLPSLERQLDLLERLPGVSGDQLLLVGELDSDDQPELGYRLLSLSYRLPLGSRLAFTTAGAISWRQLVESPPPFDDLLYRQEQLLGRFDYTLHEGLRQRLSAFASLSANRNRAWLAGERFAAIPGGGAAGTLSTGFLQTGLAWEGWLGDAGLTASLYGLQGIAAFSGDSALRELLAFSGVQVGEARALGGEIAMAWPLAPRWLLQLRAAGQGAFTPLTNPMGFSLGSDNGLRGLPSQVISGDSGLLGSGELSWAFWRRGPQELQLVPFLGAGWVHTTLPYGIDTASVGAGGLLLRWLSGRHCQLELGWASQFGDGLTRAVPNWLIDNGVYTKLSYRF